MGSVNAFKLQTANIFDKVENDRDAYAGINTHLNEKIVKFGSAVTDDVPFKEKRFEPTMVVQPSFLLDACMDTQAKKHTTILSKIKSTKNNITKIFKMTGRVSPSLLNLCPFAFSARQHCVQEVHPSLSLKSMSQPPISRSHVTTELDLPSSEQETRLEAIPSLIAYGEHVAKEHVDTFSILRCVVEAPSFPSPAHFLTLPDSPRTPSSTILLNELPTIEEAVWNPVIDAEGVEPKPLIASGPR